MTNRELWQAVLGEIELSISKANFVTWFNDTSIILNENGKVVIAVPNGFAKEWLENKYNVFILKALKNYDENIREISCVISMNSDNPDGKKGIDAVQAPNPQNAPHTGYEHNQQSSFSVPAYSQQSYHPSPNPAMAANISGPNRLESNLNPRYTFENFIVGENNELARAACYAVSQNPGKIYNPLFIYGGVGLGKTHLLQSIGNEIAKKEPTKVIKYITSERFTSELVDAIKTQKIDQFKRDYQGIDLLIIDDVQFLAGKEKTQHEFFHIFNALYQVNKQIVISSDRPPKAIQTLEERLKSRFEGGMIADVGAPDLETRMAILRSKASERDFWLEDEHLKFIAENIKSNIRELEGALNRVIASCEFNRTQPTIEYIRQVLGEIISSGKKKGISFQNIIDVITEFYNIKQEDLINKGRRKEIVMPRQIAMYLMRSELSASYPWIGQQFGGRDHTTALHAYEKINKESKENDKLKEELMVLRDKIYSL